VNIRTAKADDVESIARLYSISFPNAQKSIPGWIADLHPTPLRSWENILVAIENETLIGALVLYPFETSISGSMFRCGGIGGVAVLPEFRNQGTSKALMLEAFRIMKSTGTPISMLYPFKHSFYERLGYGLVGEVRIFQLAPDNFPSFSSPRHVVPFEEEMLVPLIDCYRAFMQKGSCLLSRNTDVWKHGISKHQANEDLIVCSIVEGVITGYLILSKLPVIEVKELVYLSTESLFSLLNFLRTFEGKAASIRMRQTSDQSFHFLYNDIAPLPARDELMYGLYPPSGLIGLGLMLRMIDVKLAFTLRRFSGCKDQVIFRVNDPLFENNSRLWKIDFRGSVEELKDLRPSDKSVEVTISTLAQLFSGYLPFSTAQQFGLIKADFDTAYLDDIFRLPSPNCFDFF
jgi:predicted acetyltransferase